MNFEIEPSVDTSNVIFPGDDPVYSTKEARERYYNFYYSYGRHFKPKSIYEIGVRAGYTAYFLLLGSGATKYRGIDLETYMINSCQIADKLIKRACPDSKVTIGNSHALTSLDQLYDLIHIDGDHSYEGKVQDLELALAYLAPGGVVVVDDYNTELGREVKRATDDIIAKYGLEYTVMPSKTGHALLKKRS